MNDLESAYQVLLTGKVNYHDAIQFWMRRLHNALSKGEIREVLSTIENLKLTTSVTADELEQAQVHLECARAFFNIKKPDMALVEINKALALLKPDTNASIAKKHYHAVASWMLGTLLVQSLAHLNDTIKEWQSGLEIFNELAYDSNAIQPDSKWYLDRCNEMRLALEKLILGQPASPIIEPPLSQQPRPPSPWPHTTLYSERRRSIPIIGTIPAGGFGPSGVEPVPIDEVHTDDSTDHFEIEGNIYRLSNIKRGDAEINLVDSREYFILKVRGDSMNRAGIDSGDYVLLRMQDTADHRDIVAAEVIGVDTEATLKRYVVVDEDIIELRPESSNAVHQPRIFKKGGQDFFIRGVVLGGFKRGQQSRGPAEVVEHVLQYYPVLEEITAGRPEATLVKTGSYLEVDHFRIDGKRFYIKSLSQGPKIKVNPDRTLVLKVTGDSMNQAHIEDGDYVLLCWQPTADSGDIVAAEIRGVDDLATLKRYSRRNGKVILSPESTNPDHEEREFAPPKPGEEPPFYIQGIAVAVFKPCEIEPASLGNHTFHNRDNDHLTSKSRAQKDISVDNGPPNDPDMEMILNVVWGLMIPIVTTLSQVSVQRKRYIIEDLRTTKKHIEGLKRALKNAENVLNEVDEIVQSKQLTRESIWPVGEHGIEFSQEWIERYKDIIDKIKIELRTADDAAIQLSTFIIPKNITEKWDDDLDAFRQLLTLTNKAGTYGQEIVCLRRAIKRGLKILHKVDDAFQSEFIR